MNNKSKNNKHKIPKNEIIKAYSILFQQDNNALYLQARGALTSFSLIFLIILAMSGVGIGAFIFSLKDNPKFETKILFSFFIVFQALLAIGIEYFLILHIFMLIAAKAGLQKETNICDKYAKIYVNMGFKKFPIKLLKFYNYK
ncbi:UNVERIFIED_CONTAM: hypothetical protein O8I53_05505 [Campylobacter lari]